jgi:hypothetical protein
MHLFFVLAELVLIGGPHAFPEIPHLLGQAMAWTGVIGLVVYPAVQVWVHRKRIREYVDSSHVIVGCLIGAAVLLIAAAITYALRPSAGVAGVAAAPTQQTTDRLVRDPSIEWPGHGPIMFRARFLKSGEKLPVYLDYGQSGGGPFTQFAVGGASVMQSRVEIGFIERFVRGQELSVTLATVAPYEGNQQVLQWGEEHYGNTKMGITWVNYFGRVVLVGRDGREEYYPFIIVSRSSENNPRPPVILGPSLITSFLEWER